MKKIVLSIAIVLSLGLLVGCSNEKETVEKTESKSIKEQTTTSDEKIDLYSDDHKIVFDNGQTKLVYYYEGEKITGYETYIDYENSATAKIAKETIEQDASIKKIYTKGRYVVIEYNESEYNTMSVSEVRLVYSYLKEIQK